MTVVLMFPGQSSRYPGMLSKLSELSDRNRFLLDAASDLLGRDLHAHYREDNAEAYGCNRDVQIGMFLANHMFLQQLQAAGVRAAGSLGLSLGEWNHLVHIGALSFRDALLAVEQRGVAYDEGPRGAMASVFPLELSELDAFLERFRQRGVIEVTNLNSPRQQVIAGELGLVEEVVAALEDELYIQAVIIERRVPMHSSLFEPVGAHFREYLQGLTFQSPELPYLPNRLGAFVPEPDQQQFVDLLSSHVHQPVLWRQSIDLVVETWPELVLVEVGPKAVLFNLLDRKWHRHTTKLHTDSNDDTAAHLDQIIAELAA